MPNCFCASETLKTTSFGRRTSPQKSKTDQVRLCRQLQLARNIVTKLGHLVWLLAKGPTHTMETAAGALVRSAERARAAGIRGADHPCVAVPERIQWCQAAHRFPTAARSGAWHQSHHRQRPWPRGAARLAAGADAEPSRVPVPRVRSGCARGGEPDHCTLGAAALRAAALPRPGKGPGPAGARGVPCTNTLCPRPRAHTCTRLNDGSRHEAGGEGGGAPSAAKGRRLGGIAAGRARTEAA